MAVEELPAREAMEFDVVIVGAGPAGLAAAIRIKQNAPDISVVIVEKGAEVGAHILSGAVIDPIGLDRLLPGWRAEETPIKTAVTDDRFYMLGSSGAIRLPNFLMPRLMNNHGNFVVSLGNVCRWLATKAEALGVDIYPGFAAVELLFDPSGVVRGVATGDMGIAKSGQRKVERLTEVPQDLCNVATENQRDARHSANLSWKAAKRPLRVFVVRLGCRLLSAFLMRVSACS